MNPFDLRGPEFLLFYLVLGALVMIALVLLRRSAESGLPIPGGLADPYLIAFLRGGDKEALSVAVLTLIDVGLLRLEGDRLVASDPEAAGKAPRSLEKAVLRALATPLDESVLLVDSAVRTSLREYKESLRQMGALPGPQTVQTRVPRFLAALLLLWGVAAAKIIVALGRRRYNIEFLILFALLFGVAAALLAFPRRTARGDGLLSDLRTLFSPLRQRVGTLTHGLEKNEFALLAATFGQPLLEASLGSGYRPFHKRRSGSAWDFSSGTGSSCGSGGSSCGSSCGGGGCGGGCGGCGG